MNGGIRVMRVEDLPAAHQDQARRQLGQGARSNGAKEPKAAKRARSKYGAERVLIDGIWFDSKREGAHYEQLKRDKAAGVVRNFWRQVIFDLPGGIVYKLDFLVVMADGAIEYRDAKGMPTKEFKIKRKLVRERYGVEVTLV